MSWQKAFLPKWQYQEKPIFYYRLLSMSYKLSAPGTPLALYKVERKNKPRRRARQ
jgi:hypothetical protein